MKKIGLFFGSFDPIHNGHLAIAKTIWENLGEITKRNYRETVTLDKIKLIPTPQNPFKSHLQQTTIEDRIKMIELVMEEFPYMELDLVELSLSSPHYTFITIEKIKKQNPNNELYFILGADSFLSFAEWENYELILQHTTLIVYDRDNPKQSNDNNVWDYKKKIESKINQSCDIIFLDKSNIALSSISSTLIREKVKNNFNILQTEELNHLIPQSVKQYIFEKKLYPKK